MIFYLLNYNSYYNRVIRKEETVNDYLSYAINELPLINVNFNPNDDVNASVIVPIVQETPDYLLVLNNNQTIHSRWFIIDRVRTTGGQYRLQLRRDLIVDYYENIIEAPCFIEKATLNLDDPLIFNKENITVNQIKTNEQLIKDRTECPWLIGYYSKKQTLTGTVPINQSDDIPHIDLDGAIENWEFYKYSNLGENVRMKGPATTGNYKYLIYVPGIPSTPRVYNTNIFNGNTSLGGTAQDLTEIGFGQPTTSTVANAFVNFGMSNLDYASYLGSKTKQTVDELLSYNGKIIKDTTIGRYYTCKVSSYNSSVSTFIQSGALYNNLKTVLEPLVTGDNFTQNGFKLEASLVEYSVTLERMEDLELSYTIDDNTKIKTTDAPWDIFALPYGEITVKSSNGTTLVTTNAQNEIATVMAMQVNHAGIIHDIQLVPYCPIQSLITNNREITIGSENQYSLVKKADDSNTAVGIIFNVDKAVFDFDITSVTVPRTQSAIERKLNNECDKWRLTSPNYSNYFDFSVEKNNGISFFNVDCNYKPFSPYIHINPNFGGLYGYDDNSPRGLVLGGDFSISQIIDQWQQYQIQNKNFQNIFDRQIQNMEVANTVGYIQDIATAAAGTFQGAVAGNYLGGKTGGVIGGIASGVAGVADVTTNAVLRHEAMDYTKDLFGYQLGNIQALPQTISKVSALNNNNKIFPILEYYTCTDREKEAIANKVAWNGMTVMTIGTINNYVNNEWSYNNIESKNYIKGQLIRLDINEDFHIINEIANEINQGIFMEVQNGIDTTIT